MKIIQGVSLMNIINHVKNIGAVIRMLHIAICGLPRSTEFCHIISQAAGFSKKKKGVTEHKMCFNGKITMCF